MNCENCHDVLLNAPEYWNREWVIRCLTCRAMNLVTAGLIITGWRNEEAK